MHKYLSLFFVFFMIESLGIQAFDHSHSLYEKVLKSYVNDGQVNYRLLKNDRENLDQYLKELNKVEWDEFSSWDNDQQLAFLLNLYNASVLSLVVDYYPIDSIKDIGSWHRSVFKLESVRYLGQRVSLDAIEYKMIRKRHKDPRVHFALVCAAKSSPALRSQPYQASILHKQLEDQGHRFIRDRSKNYIDSGSRRLYLSKIFSWFKKDFEKDGVKRVDFIGKYMTAEKRQQLKKKNYRIQYKKFDWSLNDLAEQN